MPAARLMPTGESAELIELTRSIADKELRPAVNEAERAHAFPREAFRTLGRAGLLSLPYPEEYGGGGQPYEVYLQVLEEVGARWAAVAVALSVHGLSSFALAISSVAKKAKIPYVAANAATGDLTGKSCNKYTFRLQPPVDVHARILAPYCASIGKKWPASRRWTCCRCMIATPSWSRRRSKMLVSARRAVSAPGCATTTRARKAMRRSTRTVGSSASASPTSPAA